MSAWKTVDELLAAYERAKEECYLAEWDPDGRIEMLAEEVLRLRRIPAAYTTKEEALRRPYIPGPVRGYPLDASE